MHEPVFHTCASMPLRYLAYANRRYVCFQIARLFFCNPMRIPRPGARSGISGEALGRVSARRHLGHFTSFHCRRLVCVGAWMSM